MFGKEFYPTPPDVIRQMLAPYIRERAGKTMLRLRGLSILEPSAGRGDIANFINDPHRPHYDEGYSLDCIEINPDLVNVLHGNRHTVVAHDFLSWRPSKVYDLIIMNPPFKDGAKHLIHAWNCLTGGDIVCLLNEDTIKKVCNKRRKVLKGIIDRFGEVEYLGQCFDTADRRTRVNIALVRLKKPQTDKFKHLFDKAKFEESRLDGAEKPEEVHLPARRDLVATLVAQYNETLENYKKVMVCCARLDSSLKGVRGRGISSHTRADDYVVDSLFDNNFSTGYNEFVAKFTREAWDNVLTMCGLDQLMTKQVKGSFDKQIQSCMTLAFTESNIYALLDGLRSNVDSIMTEALVEVFDLLTKFHDENRVHVEGWKTNDMYKVGKKFILPDLVKYDNGYSFTTSSRKDGLDDIDRVMCSLEGKKIGDINTIRDAIRDSFGHWPDYAEIYQFEQSFDGTPTKEDIEAFKRETANGTPGVAESEFFTIRYYKKGTIHFTFKDNSLRERFCIAYAKDKSWLPHDYNFKDHGPIPELDAGKAA